MLNLMKDNVVPVKTFPPIINWQRAFLLGNSLVSYANSLVCIL